MNPIKFNAYLLNIIRTSYKDISLLTRSYGINQSPTPTILMNLYRKQSGSTGLRNIQIGSPGNTAKPGNTGRKYQKRKPFRSTGLSRKCGIYFESQSIPSISASCQASPAKR